MRCALKDIRESQGLTQMMLSERSGVPQTTISGIENKGHAPTAKNLRKLALALGVDMEALIGKEEYQNGA
ncbi:MAG: helix-turn-helix transcriptional regulator [Peptostreptococcaceae bacterium]|nr:helix-turn-helix transcriptional regulator [Peptostreptococcaceae bacterium]